MDEILKKEVWAKGIMVEGFSPNVFRKDCCGAWIKYDDYGDYDKSYGWEIDHILPQSLGGSNDLINLRPMHWKNNREKGNDYPDYFARTKANGSANIDKIFSCTVNKELQKTLSDFYGEKHEDKKLENSGIV